MSAAKRGRVGGFRVHFDHSWSGRAREAPGRPLFVSLVPVRRSAKLSRTATSRERNTRSPTGQARYDPLHSGLMRADNVRGRDCASNSERVRGHTVAGCLVRTANRRKEGGMLSADASSETFDQRVGAHDLPVTCFTS